MRITARPTGKRSGEFFGEGYSFRRLPSLPDAADGPEFQSLLRRLYGRKWYLAHRDRVVGAQKKRRIAALADPGRAEQWRAEERERVSRYQKRHPNRVKARKQKWDAENREHRLAYARDYNRRYYAENAERIKAAMRAKRTVTP
jgi:hypothetical protein